MTDRAKPTLDDCGFSSEASAPLHTDQVERLAACIDAEPDELASGELPVLWHWACFVPDVPTASLGEDGHPRRRPDLAEFPRRMWVGGRVEVVEPLVLDEVAQRRSRVLSASLKEGSNGRHWFVTVEHLISQSRGARLHEQQDLVFREATDLPAIGPARDDPPEADWAEELRPDPVLLFRFSAVTNNAHRIHYDHDYATGVEGYPDVVVQAPLAAVLLAEMAQRRIGRPAREVSFRARAPLYANASLWLAGSLADGGGADMAAVRSDHVVAMTLRAR